MNDIQSSTSEKVKFLSASLAADRGRFSEICAAAQELAQMAPQNADLLAEIGGIFDSNDFEQEALHWYEKALELGNEAMTPTIAPHFHVWYGSTLRNVGRARDSEMVLRNALQRWNRFAALQYFLSLSLFSQGRVAEAFAAMAELGSGEWDDSLSKYSRAVQSYLQEEIRIKCSDKNLAGVTIHRIVVANVVEATQWYEKLFKCRAVEIDARFSLFELSGCQFEICMADEKNPSSTGGSVGYWNARPFDDWVMRFEVAGAALFRGPLTIPDGRRICQFQDPFGGIFGLVGDQPQPESFIAQRKER